MGVADSDVCIGEFVLDKLGGVLGGEIGEGVVGVGQAKLDDIEEFLSISGGSKLEDC